jgi:hypothetical protein
VAFDPAAAFTVVEYLATEVGPREAASAAFDEAVAYVQSAFEALGYAVITTPIPVPAGDSWGVPVGAGTSENVIADPPGFDSAAPHIVIGAHLDTVASAPGAEDNASGVGVMLELARMAAAEPPAFPVRFVAFGAEEPRGRGDSMHHFGSQAYVRDLPVPQRSAVVAMVSLDRVGVPAAKVPLATGHRHDPGDGRPIGCRRACWDSVCSVAGQSGKRPLVVREGRHPLGPRRQCALRGISFGG